MRNGNMFTMKAVNDEKTSELFSQLGGLLGVSRGSDGKYHIADLCTAGSINKWAKYKPIISSTVSNLSEDERHARNYGLRQGSDYYFHYDKPAGGAEDEWFRLRDFNGYNHVAECPMKTTTGWSGQVSVNMGANASFVMNPWNIVNTSSNVEIPLSQFGTFPTSMYMGVLIKNRRTGNGFYHSYEYTLDDVMNGASNLYSIEIEMQNAPNTQVDDILDVYYCLANSPNQRYNTNISGLIVMALDSTHGHGMVTVTGIQYEDMRATVGYVYCQYSGVDAIISAVDLEVGLLIDFIKFPMAQAAMDYRIYIYDVLFASTSIILSQGSVDDPQSGFLKRQVSGYLDISAQELDEVEFVIPVRVEAKLQNRSQYLVFAEGTYNVATGKIAMTHTQWDGDTPLTNN